MASSIPVGHYQTFLFRVVLVVSHPVYLVPTLKRILCRKPEKLITQFFLDRLKLGTGYKDSIGSSRIWPI